MRKIATIAAALSLAALVALVPGALAHGGKHGARAADRNHDGIPDSWERRNHLSLKINQAKRDPDHDGLNNRQEFLAGTNPNDADTDHDGIKDGDEVRLHLNPTKADSDGDGVKDGDEISGTIVSFDSATRELKIQPAAGGDPVSGQVTDATEIECDDHKPPTTTAKATKRGSDDKKPERREAPKPDEPKEAPEHATCTTADLQPGTAVHEAELEGGVYTKVELVK
jgi:hypothetical protein